jgi:type IV pilus assembly protein PilB
VIERYQILPLSRIQNLLTVATSNPFEFMLYDDLKELTNCDVSLVLIPPKAIAAAMENYYSEFTNLGLILEGIDDDQIEIEAIKAEKAGKTEGTPEGDVKMGEEAPVVKMVNLTLHEALRLRASDIHFEAFEKRNIRSERKLIIYISSSEFLYISYIAFKIGEDEN